MNNKVTAYCYSKFDKRDGSRIGYLIRSENEEVKILSVESRSQEYVELESIKALIKAIPSETAIELFMFAGKSFKKLHSMRSKLDKEFLALISSRSCHIYWLRNGESNKFIDKIKRLV